MLNKMSHVPKKYFDVNLKAGVQVTMTVDGQHPERWRTLGRFSYLSSSAAFLGGSDGRENIPLLRNINNLVGCIKQVSPLLFSIVS